MSTFNGIIHEFPQIRIDYFRPVPGQRPPLACFLSHVHSDHLTGLESLRAPFVYCSPATREILLRLEKYHCRLNFARGILERHHVTYDRSMRSLAKPLPLETPTTIELSPGNEIRVTLLDANHCVGAVMFLIEGRGKAVVYTGDIRAEPWWVNSIVQNPLLLPYTLATRGLDCIYLDTTFATKSQPYREFPSKADGIRELLEKIDKYPEDTVFYFHSWTFGYENVWVALSSFLHSQIHLDPYRFRIYSSLSKGTAKGSSSAGRHPYSIGIREAASLCGFQNGNHFHQGCLTSSPDVRLHSCELGMGCPVMDHNTTAVRIIPIVNRVDGADILELGAGGGKGDLDQADELETGDAEAIGKLMQLCSTKIEDEDLLSRILALLGKALEEGKEKLALGIDAMSQHLDEKMPLEELVSILTSSLSKPASSATSPSTSPKQHPPVIRFPYSRHSSYSELCHLVDALKPKDVYPCTVDENTWNPDLSIRSLFGMSCSDDVFRHDAEMMPIYEYRMERERRGKRGRDEEESQQETQRSTTVDEEVESENSSQAMAIPVSQDNENQISHNNDPPIPEAVVETSEPLALLEPETPFPALHLEQIPKPTTHPSLPPPPPPPPPLLNTTPSPKPQLPPIPRHDPNTKSPPTHPPKHPSSSNPHSQNKTRLQIEETFIQPPTETKPSSSPKSHPPPHLEVQNLLSHRPTSSTPKSPSTPNPPSARPASPHPPRPSARAIAYHAVLGTGLTWDDLGGLVSTRPRDEEEELEL